MMAKEDVKNSAPAPDPTQTTPAQKTPAQTTPKSRFTKVITERGMFNPNKGCTGSLVGYLINLEPMPAIQRGNVKQEWDSFVIMITEPCKAINREGQVIEYPVGSEILTPVTHQLSQNFSRVASHPRLCFEVSITPTKKLDIGKGQTMWIYDLGVNTNKDSVRVRTSFGVHAMLGNPELPIAQLGAKGQTGAETAGAVAEDDIPF